jgi:hypothetical protein
VSLRVGTFIEKDPDLTDKAEQVIVEDTDVQTRIAFQTGSRVGRWDRSMRHKSSCSSSGLVVSARALVVG